MATVINKETSFENGVVNLTNEIVRDVEVKNESKFPFKKLPITKNFKDYVVTINSVELTEYSAIIHLTVINNSNKPTSAEFSNQVLGYNIDVQGKEAGAGGTINIRNFPTPIKAYSESTGSVEMGSGGLDVENLVFHITLANLRDQPLSFFISL